MSDSLDEIGRLRSAVIMAEAERDHLRMENAKLKAENAKLHVNDWDEVSEVHKTPGGGETSTIKRKLTHGDWAELRDMGRGQAQAAAEKVREEAKRDNLINRIISLIIAALTLATVLLQHQHP